MLLIQLKLVKDAPGHSSLLGSQGQIWVWKHPQAAYSVFSGGAQLHAGSEEYCHPGHVLALFGFSFNLFTFIQPQISFKLFYCHPGISWSE